MMVRLVATVVLLAGLSIVPDFAAQNASASPGSSPTEKKAPFEFEQFIFVLLVRPPNPPEIPKEQLEKMQQEHLANIQRLAREGKMLKAGPLEDYSGHNARGIFILKTESADEAREWIKDDSLIKAGRLTPEFMKWYVEKGSLK